MAYELTASAIHHPHPDLTAPAWAVLVALCDAVNQNDPHARAWPGVETLAATTRYKTRCVRNALRLLEQMGLIRGTARTGTSTLYQVVIEAIAPTPAPNAPPTPAPDAGVPAPNAAPTPAFNAAPPGTKCRPPRHLMPPNQEENQEENQNTAQEPPSPPPPAPPAAPLYVWPEIFKDTEAHLLEDWATVRTTKKKRATPTATEARHFAEQAAKAGLVIDQAVELCVVRGWTRLDAAWIPPAAPAAPAVPPPPPPPPLTPEQAAEQAAAAAAARAQLSLWTKSNVDDEVVPVPPTDELQGPPWAIDIVRAARAGTPPSFRAMEMACEALGVRRASLLAEIRGGMGA